MQPKRVDISVIVPVYNHWHLIPELIDCLRNQSLGTDSFELLLVDNGSDYVPEESALPSFARLLHCATPGSYAARNEGIRNARGELLTFTDADCRPEPQWLEEGLTAFRSAGRTDVIVAGGISVVPANPDAPTTYELYDMTLGLPQARYVRRGYGITANLFVPRVVIDRVGAFDENRFSGGDAEFCRRAVRRGVGLKYCAKASICHPARSTWDDLVIKARRVKGGQLTAGPRRSRIIWAVRTVIPPVWAWLNALRAKRLSPKQRLVVCVLQGRLWFVEIAELVRLLLKRGEAQR